MSITAFRDNRDIGCNAPNIELEINADEVDSNARAINKTFIGIVVNNRLLANWMIALRN